MEDQKPTTHQADGVYNFSSKKRAMEEPVDSEKDESVPPPMISNSTLLDCYYCSEPLRIPVSQCDNGHITCRFCSPGMKNGCHKCKLHVSSDRCKVVEDLLLSIEMPCQNAKYGCKEIISYIGNRKHEKECIHEPCYCPFSGCDFVASSKVLSNHFSNKHGDSQIRFSYDHKFIVSLKSNSNDETIVLHEENDGKLFILNNSTTKEGNAVNICCIGPNMFGYSYDMMARSQNCKLKLQSFVKNVPQFTLATLSSEFLMIPFSSSKLLELEICIEQLPMMQIFVMKMDQSSFPLRVKSSDTIGDVKWKIFVEEWIPCSTQLLFFSGRQLDHKHTLGYYNIQEKATIRLNLRMFGD